MPKALIFENHPACALTLERSFKTAQYETEVITRIPASPEDPMFRELLSRAPQFDVIVWGSRMETIEGGFTIYTHEGFIQAFAEVFKGPMIANSSMPEERQKLRSAGCNYSCNSKENAVGIALLHPN